MVAVQRWHVKELCSHRHADDLGIAKIPFGLLKMYRCGRYAMSDDLVGEAGNIIWLKRERRNMHHDRRGHGRPGSVSAHANHHIRMEDFDDPPRIHYGLGQVEQRSQAGDHAYVFERAYFHPHQPKTRLWNQTVFDASGRAHKQDFGIVAGFQFTSNRQRRDYMPSGTAARYENAHALGRLSPECSRSKICDQIFIEPRSEPE